MSMMLTGVGASRGVAIGKAQLLHRGVSEAPRHTIRPREIEPEVARLKRALQRAGAHLRQVRDSLPADVPADIAGFIESHLLMLDDYPLVAAPVEAIRERRLNAEWALQIQCDKLLATFDQIQDDYLRTRRDDIAHVFGLVRRFLDDDARGPELEADLSGRIIVADDLTPADTIVLQHRKIAAFVTEFGGPTSHTAILARSIGIPSVVAANNVRALLTDGEQIIVDGESGMVIADADAALLDQYRRRLREERSRARRLALLRDREALSQDQVRVKLLANIELTEDLRLLKKTGAEGVGLYRTEFLYLERSAAADEEEQLRAYRKTLRAMGGKPVVIRTLDIGAEKEFDPHYEGPLAPNPALGLRAIRRSLRNADDFTVQLRALLRASAYGEVRILLPMLTNVHELEQSMQLLETAKEELRQRGRKFDENIRVGGMIEVPAAALGAELFARRLDFLSIGTNDLIQYTLAIDRIDETVNYLHDPLHPGVLKLVAMVIAAGRASNTPVAMCGEMAGDPRYTRLLLGMGLREFSAHPSALPEIKEVILDSNIASLTRRCRRILRCDDPHKIAPMVRRL